MPIPNLIHPVPIKIRQIQRGATYYDEDAREPIQHASRSTTKTISGQVKWRSQFELGHEKGGPTEGAAGYVLFRKIDLEAQAIELQDGDRFVEIGNRETDVYVTALRPVGHYPDRVGYTMIKAFFEDRQPSKQTRGA